MYGPYGKFVIYSYILTCIVDKFIVYNNKYFVWIMLFLWFTGIMVNIIPKN